MENIEIQNKSKKSEIIFHIIFWGFVLAVMIFFDYRSAKTSNFLFIFSNEIINIFIYAMIVYFNLLYLIPNYLTKKKILTYFGLLLLIVIIITPIKAIIFYFKFSEIPNAQEQIVNDLNWYFFPTFLVATGSTLFKIIIDWGKQQREKQILQTQTMLSELQFLKSQINPHFLFNTLNNLYALTLKKSDKAPDVILKLSEMLRYMLYECNEKKVPLKNEIKYLKNYLDLEKLRQGTNYNINFKVTGRISGHEIAPLLFIPFLENSIKHGLNHHLSKGFIDIYLSVKNDNVRFSIRNSKPQDIPTTEHAKSGGIGLVNVKRRLNILYPKNYELKIDNTPDTYYIDLKIDMSKLEEDFSVIKRE